VQAHNCTTVLSSEFSFHKLNKFLIETADKFNSIALRDESNQVNVKTMNKNEFVQEKEDIVEHSKCESEKNTSNKIDITVHQLNIINKTQDIEIDKLLNDNEIKLEKDISLNKIQDISNKINILNESQVIAKDEQNSKKVNVQNRIQSLSHTVENFEEKEAILKYSNQVFNEEIQYLNSVSKPVLSYTKEKDGKVFTVEKLSPGQSEKCVQNEIKVSNKSDAFIRKEVEKSNSSETLLIEESCKTNKLNIEVIASTPLPTKIFTKENTKESASKKGALFVKESEVSVLKNEKKLNKDINTLAKKGFTEDDGNIINFDETVAINKSFEKLFSSELILKDNLEVSNNLLHENSLNLLPPQESEYEAFKPQQQSTNLPLPDPSNFRALQEAALSVAKDIDDSLEKIEESEHFVSATTECKLFTSGRVRSIK
jgi:hypothetical protein